MTEAAQSGGFTLTELVDLALCSPEVGAVNFNILRILLHEILAKLGIVEQPATLNDVEAHQIQNFQNYIQGAGTASPMPGVLRYAPGTQASQPAQTPRTGRLDQGSGRPSQESGRPFQGSGRPSQESERPSQPKSAPTSSRQSTGTGQHPQVQSIGAVYARESIIDSGQDAAGPQSVDSLNQKVARLERHLEALYALPTNSTLLGTGKHEQDDDHHLSVNDMWQIIQLNNRVAAAEAAIQKMASLIEDMATQLKGVKRASANASGMQKDMDKLNRTSSDMAMQMEPCIEKCERTAESLGRLKQDLEKIKAYVMEKIRKLSDASGVEVSRSPSFMQPRQSVTDAAKRQSQKGSLTSEGQDRRTSGSQRGSLTSDAEAAAQAKQRQQGSQKGSLTSDGTRAKSVGQADLSKGATFGEILVPRESRGSGNYNAEGKRMSGVQQFDLIAIPAAVDADGRRVSNVEWVDSAGNVVEVDMDEDGRPIVFGADGKRISSPHELQYDEQGNAMFYDKNGRRIVGSQKPLIGPDGQPIPFRQSTYDENGVMIEQGGYETLSGGDLGSGSQEFLTDGSTGRTSQDMGVDGHGEHPDEGNLTDAHPDVRHQGISHVPVDVSGVPLDELEAKLDPFTDFKYPTIQEDGKVVPGKMDPRYEEECKNQADVVQKELQDQYIQLQEMQRQMAEDIQDKMELVYQKLLKEIAAQHATTSPYMAVGLNAEKCLGPGVCTGFGLPAGTAVCQFPQKPDKVDVCRKGDGKVCPGKDVCPGKEVCPTCKDDVLHHLRMPGDRSKVKSMDYPTAGLSSSKENLLRQMTSMTLLPRDLEELREKLKNRGTMPDVFDEVDVLEKLQTVWEAVNILKNNEENMAVRLVQQDAILKKIPDSAIEKLDRLSPANLDNLNAGRFSKIAGMKEMSGDDVQLIFNNLSSLVLENGAMKEKLQKISEALADFEQLVVTKPMLMNALTDKADKGQINTKVSYDEFGAGMDELQARLGNLLQEVYRKNELWKEITDQMREDLGEKLDKVEIAPIRAYFKNHLGKLEEKVNHLTRIMDEPDPAGTRKKLLKDYNCISCDRHTNISGLTNAPLLPVLGPILAGHSTASQRAFELYRMRPQTSRYDVEGRNYCKMECQGRGDPNNNVGGSMGLCESDMMHLVNRYVGGSHTAISPQDRISALHKRASLAARKQSMVAAAAAPPEPPVRTSIPPAPPAQFFDE